MQKRIVITGFGAITPLGNTADAFWNNIRDGKSAVRPITLVDTSDIPTKYAAEVKDFDPLLYLEKREMRKMDRFSHFAVAATRQALAHSQLNLKNIDPYRIISVHGVGIGGMDSYESSLYRFVERGYKGIPVMTIPKIIANGAPANAALIEGNLCGLNYAITTACSSGTDAIGAAVRHLLLNEADVVIAGGSESTITRYGIGSFNVLHALSTKWVDTPEKASRPFDKDRDGFVMGEGSAVFILETLEHAKNRGAKIYAEFSGYGGTCDAYHYTAPHPNGDGAIKAMQNALANANIPPDSIDYINAHGTATPTNDPIETHAIKMVFGDKAIEELPFVSSTKSMTGHCIGAAGAIEALACIYALMYDEIPPTINLDSVDEDCKLNHVINKSIKTPIHYTMSNTFGFGGHNGVVILKKYKNE